MEKYLVGFGFAGALLGAGLLGGGCGGIGDNSLFGAGAAAAASTGQGDGGHGGAGVGGHGGAPAVTASVGHSSTSSASMVTTGTTGTATATSSASTGGGCGVDPSDNECVKCTKTDCCSTLTPCQNDPACVCWTGCIAQNPGNPGACSATCGPYDQTTNSFITCASQSCGAACSGSSSSSSTSAASVTSAASTGPGPASSSSSGGGGACGAQAGDSACTSCSKQKCCSDVTACSSDQNCICWVYCSQYSSGALCQSICQAQSPVTKKLFSCAVTQCPSQCM